MPPFLPSIVPRGVPGATDRRSHSGARMADVLAEQEVKLQRFLQWLQANGGQLRGCSIDSCGPSKGFGVFASSASGSTPDDGSGVFMVVPLDLAITPMRVLQDPSLGSRCAEMFKEGDVDDRFLMMLFLTVERLRRNSPWKPYFDMLPSTFNSPLWFTDDELLELKGTTLYRATVLQKKKLRSIFDDKVRPLVEEILCVGEEVEGRRNVQFEDFLWANSIFWTRALNIPFPRSYVFPSSVEEEKSCDVNLAQGHGSTKTSALNTKETAEGALVLAVKDECADESIPMEGDPIWVEGLIPGIDFCNHGLQVLTTWEVDETGGITGVPFSMYLVSSETSFLKAGDEISISYGNKGNEELLYLYGFVMENNPDDYLMVHYPIEALQNVSFADSKAHLLEVQKAELRCLLPKSLLDRGFFSGKLIQDVDRTHSLNQHCGYSWSGQRKVPPYLNKLVFPEEFLTALRTISLQEHELTQVSSLLGELVGSEQQEIPSGRDVQAAVWEAVGDFGALELLIDLLRTRLMELEEGSGTEAQDTELLDKLHLVDSEESERMSTLKDQEKQMNMNRWSSIVYRRGQKQLTSLFLKEAEHALELLSNDLP